jgi:hypothetical protein
MKINRTSRCKIHSEPSSLIEHFWSISQQHASAQSTTSLPSRRPSSSPFGSPFAHVILPPDGRRITIAEGRGRGRPPTGPRSDLSILSLFERSLSEAFFTLFSGSCGALVVVERVGNSVAASRDFLVLELCGLGGGVGCSLLLPQPILVDCLIDWLSGLVEIWVLILCGNIG